MPTPGFLHSLFPRISMHLNRFILPALFLGVFHNGAVAQSLNAEQQKIIASVNADQQNSAAFLKQLVDINSGTLNPAGVRKVADVLRPEFESLGFTCRWIPMEEVQ